MLGGLVYLLTLLLLLLLSHFTAQRQLADPRFDLDIISSIRTKFSTLKNKNTLFLVRDATTRITYILEHSIRLPCSLFYKLIFSPFWLSFSVCSYEYDARSAGLEDEVVEWPSEILQAFHLADPYRNITDVYNTPPLRIVRGKGKTYVIENNEKFHINYLHRNRRA